MLKQPVFVPRNVLMSTPAVALALAPALGDRRWPRYVAPALLVVVLAARAIPVVRGGERVARAVAGGDRAMSWPRPGRATA